jgi:hypothetical protein
LKAIPVSEQNRTAEHAPDTVDAGTAFEANAVEMCGRVRWRLSSTLATNRTPLFHRAAMGAVNRYSRSLSSDGDGVSTR